MGAEEQTTTKTNANKEQWSGTLQNITTGDEILARTLITKFEDLYAKRVGIPDVLKKMTPIDKKTVAYNYKNHKLYFIYHNHDDLQEIAAMIYENFEKEQYKSLEVKDKIVIDIGAAIGDTAIYFALVGKAKHVYAFEPQPYSYRRAVENIKLNALEDKITLFNEAIGNKKGTISLTERIAVGGSKMKEESQGKQINITTLPEVINRLKLTKEIVLKMDCEGTEYEILLNNPGSPTSKCLKQFNQIMVEYHYGYRNIGNLLISLGFKIWHSRPRVVFYDPAMRLGLLTAVKQKD